MISYMALSYIHLVYGPQFDHSVQSWLPHVA